MARMTKKSRQSEAIIASLKGFLDEFNCAFYALPEPVKQLEKYFDLHTDGDGVIHVSVKTYMGDFPHGYILDVDIADLQSIINWLKRYTENILRHVYNLDV